MLDETFTSRDLSHDNGGTIGGFFTKEKRKLRSSKSQNSFTYLFLESLQHVLEHKTKHGNVDTIDFLPDLQKKTKYEAAEMEAVLSRLKATGGRCFFITFRALALVQDPGALAKIKAFMDSEPEVAIILLVKTYDNVLKAELNSVCDRLDCHRVWLEIDKKHAVFRPKKVETKTRTRPKTIRRRPLNQLVQRPSLASSSSLGSAARGLLFGVLALCIAAFN